MKKAISVILTALLCIGLSACSGNVDTNKETITDNTSSNKVTIQIPVEKTTKAPEKNAQKGNELRASVADVLNSDNLSGDFSYGKFTYKYNRDAITVYANERDEAFEKLARRNADKLVEKISDFYTDDITLFDTNANDISFGDNGIDSVRYEFYYANTQNQILTIYADSDGVISYADCAFTW